jgi:hypothetical protein
LCDAGPVAVFTIGDHLRRFFNLSARYACKWCIHVLEARHRKTLGEAASTTVG